jgi:hypothetical protein
MKANGRARRARSPWQLYPAFGLAALLLGCVTQSGPPLASLATVRGPPKGMARIVVVRLEKGTFQIGDSAFPVKIDGQPLGEVITGTFAYQDCPPGPHQLSAELFGWPGTTRHDFTAAPGRTYFFRAKLDEKVNELKAFSMISPLGGAVASVATFNDRQGPIDLIPISEAEAKQAMAAAQAAAQ